MQLSESHLLIGGDIRPDRSMLVYYRGHIIVMLADEKLTAEITEQITSAPLPTTASASLDEGEVVCIERAKALIDLYLSKTRHSGW